MASRPLDSKNPAVRAIERWKRGIVAGIIFAMVVGGSTLVASLPVMIVLDALGVEGWTGITSGVIALILSPWVLGDRFVLRTIGSLATTGDDER